MCVVFFFVFFFQAEDGIRGLIVTGVQTCALPISRSCGRRDRRDEPPVHGHTDAVEARTQVARARGRSEEHTSELQSRSDLVCRLLLEKKKKKTYKKKKNKKKKNKKKKNKKKKKK